MRLKVARMEAKTGGYEQSLAKYGYTTDEGMDGESSIIDGDGEIVDFDELPEKLQEELISITYTIDPYSVEE